MSFTIPGYRSTSLSQTGYTDLLCSVVPNKWYSDAARAPGGNLYAFFSGIAAALANMDAAQVQAVLSEQRLQTSTGAAIQSWSNDFLGVLLTQFSSEPDAAFIARIMTWLQARTIMATGAGILMAVNMYLQILQYLPKMGPIGLDSLGGLDTTGALDNPVIIANQPGQFGISTDTTQGGLDDGRTGLDISSPAYNPPVAVVFDWQDNPTLATLLSLPQNEGCFCVYIQYPNYSDNLIHQFTTVPLMLSQWVNAVKAEGTQAIYATNLS